MEAEIIELMSLVKTLAIKAKYENYWADLEELIAEGNLALVRCANRFDSAKKASLYTYSIHRIKGAILDSLRAQRRDQGFIIERKCIKGKRYNRVIRIQFVPIDEIEAA